MFKSGATFILIDDLVIMRKSWTCMVNVIREREGFWEDEQHSDMKRQEICFLLLIILGFKFSAAVRFFLLILKVP